MINEESGDSQEEKEREDLSEYGKLLQHIRPPECRLYSRRNTETFKPTHHLPNWAQLVPNIDLEIKLP
jgi:hypothetical protein